MKEIKDMEIVTEKIDSNTLKAKFETSRKYTRAVKFKYPGNFTVNISKDGVETYLTSDGVEIKESEIKKILKSKEFLNFEKDDDFKKLNKENITSLAKIDLKSIPYIREWIAKQANAPKELVDLENEAKAIKDKMK